MKIAFGSFTSKPAADLAVVFVTESSLASDAHVDALDGATKGLVRGAVREEEFKGKKDTQLAVAPRGTAGALRRVLLVGLGPDANATPASFRTAAARAARYAQAEKLETLALGLPAGATAATLRAVAEGLTLGAYRFTRYFTGDRKPKKDLGHATLVLAGGGKASKAFLAAISEGVATAEAVNTVRDLVNEPPNELPPAALASFAERMAKKGKLSVQVWDHARIRKEGMKLLDAVGRGSTNGPRFVHMSWIPAGARKGRKRIAVVGKGLTFDSGGLCIKPAQGMGDMKSDMAGAALSVGIMQAVAALAPSCEIHGIFAAAENMPDGDAYRPGDIFGSLDGKTVEIVNTDAEGRLVLADALAYAKKLQPDVIIDHATLTGACVVALGTGTAAVYSNDEALATRYVAASRTAGESMWHMPLIEDLREQLKSDVADLKHTGDRFGGSISAALFLREFVGDCKWIHLDIAGPAFADRPTALSPKGGTGYGVLTFLEFVRDFAG